MNTLALLLFVNIGTEPPLCTCPEPPLLEVIKVNKATQQEIHWFCNVQRPQTNILAWVKNKDLKDFNIDFKTKLTLDGKPTTNKELFDKFKASEGVMKEGITASIVGEPDQIAESIDFKLPPTKAVKVTNGFNCGAKFCGANGGAGCPNCPNGVNGQCVCGQSNTAVVTSTPVTYILPQATSTQSCPNGNCGNARVPLLPWRR